MSHKQTAEYRSKALILIILVFSSGLVAPFSSSPQSFKMVKDTGQAHLSGQLLKYYNSGVALTSQKGEGIYLSSTGEGVNPVLNSMPPPSSIDSQTPQLVSGLNLPQQQIIPSTNVGVLLLRDSQSGQTLVMVYRLGQNIESNRTSPLPLLFTPLLGVWLDSERRRSRFRIYVEILDLLKQGPMTPYEVAFHLRLNRKKSREYMEFLKENAFLEFAETDGRSRYGITAEGKTFVENLKAVLEVERNGRFPETSG